MKASSAPRSRELANTLANLATDAAAVEVLRELSKHGIAAILLKGPALDRLLYNRRGERAYTDSDLLVAPSDLSAAERILARLGFDADPPFAMDHHFDPEDNHAHPWRRRRDGVVVDLHRTLAGALASPRRVWEVLEGETEPFPLGSVQASTLNELGLALVIALHAGNHGPRREGPLRDLARALDRLQRSTWAAAARLAERIDAEFAFAAGLRLLPRGGGVADDLGLPRHFPAETALHVTQSASMSLHLEALAVARGPKAKLRLMRLTLFPPVRMMRAWSTLANRGPVGLGAAYAKRVLRIPVAGVPALVSWRRARSHARRHGLS